MLSLRSLIFNSSFAFCHHSYDEPQPPPAKFEPIWETLTIYSHSLPTIRSFGPSLISSKLPWPSLTITELQSPPPTKSIQLCPVSPKIGLHPPNASFLGLFLVSPKLVWPSLAIFKLQSPLSANSNYHRPIPTIFSLPLPTTSPFGLLWACLPIVRHLRAAKPPPPANSDHLH